MLPEEISGGLDAYRLPLSAIRDADVVVVLGECRSSSALRSSTSGSRRAPQTAPGPRQTPTNRRGEAERVVSRLVRPRRPSAAADGRKLARSSASPAARAAAPSSLPRGPRTAAVSPTPGPLLRRGGAAGDRSACSSCRRRGGPPTTTCARSPSRPEATIVLSMFGGLAAGWADLILPGTGYLEREGTFVNLEGRLQRLRRTVEPPCPTSSSGSRSSPRGSASTSRRTPRRLREVSERVYGGLAFGEVGERAPLRGYPEAQEHVAREPCRSRSRSRARGDPARRLQAALLRRGRRARHGASVPATAARARALGRRRAAAQDRDRRPRHGRLERQRDHAAGARATALCARASRASRSSTRTGSGASSRWRRRSEVPA
jgi:hypothetical protein